MQIGLGFAAEEDDFDVHVATMGVFGVVQGPVRLSSVVEPSHLVE
jgi:hypothetical protein